jgi:Leucine-rich repeat (LRR) protein
LGQASPLSIVDLSGCGIVDKASEAIHKYVIVLKSSTGRELITLATPTGSEQDQWAGAFNATISHDAFSFQNPTGSTSVGGGVRGMLQQSAGQQITQQVVQTHTQRTQLTRMQQTQSPDTPDGAQREWDIVPANIDIGVGERGYTSESDIGRLKAENAQLRALVAQVGAKQEQTEQELEDARLKCTYLEAEGQATGVSGRAVAGSIEMQLRTVQEELALLRARHETRIRNRVNTAWQARAVRIQASAAQAWANWLEFVARRDNTRQVLLSWDRKVLARRLVKAFTTWRVNIRQVAAAEAAAAATAAPQPVLKPQLNRRNIQSRIQTASVHSTNSSLQLCWVPWKRHWQRQTRNRLMISRCVVAKRSRIAMACWRQWMGFAQWRVQAHANLKAWQNCLAKREVVHAMAIWKNHTVQMRLLEWATKTNQLVALRERVKQNRIANATTGKNFSCERMCWAAWKARWKREKHNRSVVSHASVRYRFKKASLVWDTWLAFVSLRSRARNVLVGWQNKIYHRGLSWAWTRWCHNCHIDKMAGHQETQHTVREDKINVDRENAEKAYAQELASLDVIQALLHSQCERIKNNRVDRAISHANQGRMRLCWIAWRARWQRVARNEYIVSRCVGTVTNRKAAWTWKSWLLFVSWRANARAQLEAWEKRVYNRSLICGMTKWKAFHMYTATESTEMELWEIEAARKKLDNQREVIKQNRVGRAIATMGRGFVNTCWGAWKARWKRQIRNRHIVGRCIESIQSRKAATSWRQWKAYVSWRDEARVTLTAWETRVHYRENALAMVQWKAFHLHAAMEKTEHSLFNLEDARSQLEEHRERIKENRIGRAVTVKAQAFVVLCWKAWKARWQRVARNQYIVTRCVQTIKGKRSSRFWQSWLDFVNWRADTRAALQAWEDHLCHRQLRHGWAVWMSFIKGSTIKQRFEQLSSEKQAAHDQEREESAEAYGHELETAAEEKEKLHQQHGVVKRNRVVGAIARTRNACVVMCWGAWKARFQREVHNRNIVGRCIDTVKSKKRAAVWQSWLAFVDWRAGARAALTSWENRVRARSTGRAMGQWKAFVLSTTQEATQVELTTLSGARMRLDQQRLVIKRNRVDRAVAKARSAGVLMCWSAWKAKWKRENRNRNVVSKCASGRTKRTEVAAWKSWMEFVTWRVEVRTKLTAWQNHMWNRDKMLAMAQWKAHALCISQEHLHDAWVDTSEARSRLDIHREVLKQNRVGRAVARARDASTLLCWNAWKARWRREIHNRTVLSHAVSTVKRHNARQTWQSWCEFVSWRNDVRAKILDWNQRVCGRSVSLAFTKWKEHHQTICREDLIAELETAQQFGCLLDAQVHRITANRTRVACGTKQNCVHMCWDAWKLRWQKQQRTRFLVSKFTTKRIERIATGAWAAFADFSSRRDEVRSALQSLQQRIDARKTVGSWVVWKQSHNMKLCNEFHLNHLNEIESAHTQELEEIQESNAQELELCEGQQSLLEQQREVVKQNRVSRAIAQIQSSCVVMCWGGWKARWQREARNRYIADRSVGTIRAKKASASWQVWLSFLSWREETRVALREWEARSDSRLMVLGWATWKWFNEQVIASRERMKLRDFHEQQTEEFTAAYDREREEQHNIFEQEVETRQQLEQQREVIKRNRVGRAIAKLQNAGLQMCFDALKAFRRRQSRNRAVVAKSITVRQSRRCSATWRVWREFVSWREEARAALLEWENRGFRRSLLLGFTQWRLVSLNVEKDIVRQRDVDALIAVRERLHTHRERITQNRVCRAVAVTQSSCISTCWDAWRAQWKRSKRSTAVADRCTVTITNRRASAAWRSWLLWVQMREEARVSIDLWKNRVCFRGMMWAMAKWKRFDGMHSTTSVHTSRFEELSASSAKQQEDMATLHAQMLEAKEGEFADQLGDMTISHRAHLDKIIAEKDAEIARLQSWRKTVEAETASDRAILVKFHGSNGGINWTKKVIGPDYPHPWWGDGDMQAWGRGELEQMPGVAMQLGRVDHVDLRANNVIGDIPRAIFELSALTRLVLPDNELSGEIPDDLANLKQLQHLDLSGNTLSGPIPGAIGEMPSLMELLLGNNALSGPIPETIGKCRALVHLQLCNNQLSGSLPRQIVKLRKLTFLNLENNKLEGNYTDRLSVSSAALSDFPVCIYFQGRYRRASGTCRVWKALTSPTIVSRVSCLPQMTNAEIWLTGSFCSGVVPNELGELVRLQGFDCSNNVFVGPLPGSISGCLQLDWLNVSHNRMSGEVPESLTDCVELTVLDISFNKFEGDLPSLIGMRALSEVRVAGNDSLQNLEESKRLCVEHFGTRFEFIDAHIDEKSVKYHQYSTVDPLK